MAAGTSVGQVGTEFEQLVGKLLNMQGDPGKKLTAEFWMIVLLISYISLWWSVLHQRHAVEGEDMPPWKISLLKNKLWETNPSILDPSCRAEYLKLV